MNENHEEIQDRLDKLVEKCVKSVYGEIEIKDQVAFLSTLADYCLTNLAINLTELKFENLLKFILSNVEENKDRHKSDE